MKCFYHNDIDGRCAGAIVARFENNYDKNNFFEVDYVAQLPIDKIEEDERIYLVDYSFKGETAWQLEAIKNKTNDVIWIDHHISSLRLEEKIPWVKEIKGLRQDKISGAALTYMYLHECSYDDIPLAVKYVSDYDCWIFKYDLETTNFKLGLESVKHNALDSIWKSLLDLDVTEIDSWNLIRKGEVIKSYVDTDNENYRNLFSYESEISGHKCMVVNKKSNSLIFGEHYKTYPIVMTWVFDGKKYVYSIYTSNSEIDCSKIAESYGGGGHKSAAGFSSDELLFKKL